MDNLFITIVLFILLVYGLIIQVRQTVFIQKANEKSVRKYKRTLIGNYVTLISFLGFSVSLMLNLTNMLSQNYTAIACYAFLTILLIAKFGVIPKQRYRLLNRL